LKGEHPLGGSEYWGCLEGRAEGGVLGTEALSLVRVFFFFVLLSHVYSVAYKEWPVFEYLDSNYGAILGGLRDKRKAVYRGPQSTFPPFYRKGLIGVWYYNLRNTVKAISLGHPRDTEARPQYKER
jgi:hypothetical protein